jgi:hypothetical protein
VMWVINYFANPKLAPDYVVVSKIYFKPNYLYIFS